MVTPHMILHRERQRERERGAELRIYSLVGPELLTPEVNPIPPP